MTGGLLATTRKSDLANPLMAFLINYKGLGCILFCCCWLLWIV